MNIENFYALLASADRDSLQLAWTMARGFRDAGIEGFKDFTDAVYKWGLSDRPAQHPVDFLEKLKNGTLHQYYWYKPDFPECTKTFAPLVQHLLIDELPLSELPKNWHYLPNLQTLSLKKSNVKCFGAQLLSLSKIEKINLHSYVDVEFIPEFCQLTSLQQLIIYTYHKAIIFPKNIGQMSNLKTLKLQGNYQGVQMPINMECFQQLTTLKISINLTTDYGFLATFSELENLTLALDFEAKTLPSFLKKMPQLKHLTIAGSDLHGKPFPKWFVELPIETFTFYGYSGHVQRFFVLNQMPHIKTLYLALNQWTTENVDRLKNNCPQLTIKAIENI